MGWIVAVTLAVYFLPSTIIVLVDYIRTGENPFHRDMPKRPPVKYGLVRGARNV